MPSTGQPTMTSTWATHIARNGELKTGTGAREAAAVEVLNYQPTIIPDLLQTDDYMRRVLSVSTPRYIPEQVEVAAAARQARQVAAVRTADRFRFVLAETALLWQAGTVRAHAEQLVHLAGLISFSQFEIGIIPAGPAGTTLQHGFVIYQGETTAEVSVGLVHGEVNVAGSPDVTAYKVAWEQLQKAAVYGPYAIEVVDRLTSGLVW